MQMVSVPQVAAVLLENKDSLMVSVKGEEEGEMLMLSP